MEEWKEYKLGDCVEVVIDNRGKSAPTKPMGEFPLLEINSIGGYYPNYSVIRKYVNKVTYNTWFRSGHPICGDILIPTVGTIGIISIMDNHKACIAQNLIALRTKKEISNIFIYYFLKSPIVKKQLINLDIGGVQPSIKVPHLLNLSISLPEKDIQHKIASILSSLDDKIEVNRRINENLEQQAQALFKSWFVDFEPFKNGEFVESVLGMIPKGWRVKRIYEYIDVIYGAPYKSSLFNDNKEGLPLIRIRDLKTNNPQFYTPEILPNTEYVEAGDIVAGMDAEFTPYVWQGEKGVLNQRCCKFKGKYEGISNYFILFLIKPELEYVQSYKTGTTVSHLGKSDIDRFVFLTPPLDVVLDFSEIVNPIIKEVVNRAKESRRLAELRDTLLPKLMSGELKVNEIVA